MSVFTFTGVMAVLSHISHLMGKGYSVFLDASLSIFTGMAEVTSHLSHLVTKSYVALCDMFIRLSTVLTVVLCHLSHLIMKGYLHNVLYVHRYYGDAVSPDLLGDEGVPQ